MNSHLFNIAYAFVVYTLLQIVTVFSFNFEYLLFSSLLRHRATTCLFNLYIFYIICKNFNANIVQRNGINVVLQSVCLFIYFHALVLSSSWFFIIFGHRVLFPCVWKCVWLPCFLLLLRWSNLRKFVVVEITTDRAKKKNENQLENTCVYSRL